MKIPAIVAGALVLITMALPSSAEAETGRLRLGLDTSLLAFSSHFNEDGDATGSNFSFTLGDPNLGVILGARIVRGLVIGARVNLGVARYTNDDETFNQATLEYGLMPFVEYMFLNGPVRPSVFVNFGIGGRRIASSWENEGADDEDVENFLFFPLMFGGGVHFFPIDQFSIDLTAHLGYRWGVWNPDEDRSPEDNAFAMEVLVGISGWI